MSKLTASMNLVTTMVGASVLSFPALFAKAGCVLAPTILLSMAWVTHEIGITVCKCLDDAEQRADTGKVDWSFGRTPLTFEDLGEAAFGKSGKLAIGLITNLILLTFCGALTILVGSSLEFVSNATMPYRFWVIAASVMFFFMGLLKDMSIVSKLSPIGVMTSVIYVVSICQAGYFVVEAGKEAGLGLPETHMAPRHLLGLGSVVAVMLLGFFFVMVVPPVRAGMENPAEMPEAILIAVCIVTTVYMLVGGIGYYGWGAHVEGNVLESMVDPVTGKRLISGIVLSLAIISNLMVTYPILVNCVVVAFEATLTGGRYSPQIRIITVLISILQGLLCPYFLEVIGVMASIGGVCMSVFIPIPCFWKLAQNTSTCKKVKHIVICIIGFLALVFGTWDSMSELCIALDKGGGNPLTHFWVPMHEPM